MAMVVLAGCGDSVALTLTPTLAPTMSPTLAPTVASAPTRPPGRWLVEVGEGRFSVEVADDAEERRQGLSGRATLADGAGMWFDLWVAREARFWMREMLIPLDMVWVDAGLEVVAVTADVPFPVEGTATSDLPLYGPDALVRYVLEINAGSARAMGIEPGMQVSITGP
jgi:uncharacterized membrane protein (UPF0127 family)